MDETQQIQQFRDAIPKAIARSWSDEAFRSQLMSDPNGAFGAFGVKVPPHFQIKVVDATAGGVGHVTVEKSGDTSTMTIPLPPKPHQLSDEELDAVAGGGTCSSSSTCCTA
jgi:hypothetical protein